MPTFYYRAKTKKAETVEGQILADSKDDAVEKINQLGLIPVLVEQGLAGRKKRGWGDRRVRTKEVYLFSRQLVSLLKAGVPILRSLEAIASQTRNPYFQGVVESISLGIRGGKSFSDCLAEYPRIFPVLYATMVKAGEEAGRLKESVLAMAEYMRRQNEISSKVKTALVYPLLMALFGTGTVIFILTYVMPQITCLFVDRQQVLPIPTIVVMQVSQFLITWWAVVLLAVLVAVGGLRTWSTTDGGRRALSRMQLGFPVFGPLWLKVEIARFCRTMELLLHSNVSLIRAMQLAIPVVHNGLIRDQLASCQDELLAGRSFGESLKQTKLIPPMLGAIVTVGEESGTLGDTFREIAESHEQEIAEVVKILTTLLEPLLILIVGALIGFIVMAMLLPIFQLDVFAH